MQAALARGSLGSPSQPIASTTYVLFSLATRVSLDYAERLVLIKLCVLYGSLRKSTIRRR